MLQTQPLTLKIETFLFQPLPFHLRLLPLVLGLLCLLIGGRVAPILRACRSGDTTDNGAGPSLTVAKSPSQQAPMPQKSPATRLLPACSDAIPPLKSG